MVDIGQAIDRQQYLGFTAGRWLWWFADIKAGRHGLIAKFKEAGGTVREIDAFVEQKPPRLSPFGYLHHRLPVMGC